MRLQEGRLGHQDCGRATRSDSKGNILLRRDGALENVGEPVKAQLQGASEVESGFNEKKELKRKRIWSICGPVSSAKYPAEKKAPRSGAARFAIARLRSQKQRKTARKGSKNSREAGGARGDRETLTGCERKKTSLVFAIYLQNKLKRRREVTSRRHT